MAEEAKSQSGIHRRSSRLSLENSKNFRPEFNSQIRGEEANEKMWELMAEYLDSEPLTI
jgi:hypothetical protein